jgi:YgiT-type zinc finger domain-containing protein
LEAWCLSNPAGILARRKEVVEDRKTIREEKGNESQKEQTGAQCPDASPVSAGLQDVLGMTEWRKEHPKATWQEIEAAVDERINQLRAQMIQDVIQMGETQDWSQHPEEERPRCATCGEPLLARGTQTRWLQTTGGEAVKLRRTYGTCPSCGGGFFPPG